MLASCRMTVSGDDEGAAALITARSVTASKGMFFCSSVSDALIQRSSVLLSVKQSDSMRTPVALPSSISQADFQLWADNDPDRQTSLALAIKDVATIFKVADVLSDVKCEAWRVILSDKVAKCKWRGCPATRETICALLLLPNHLQHSLFSRIVRCYSTELDAWMIKLPVAVHSAVISSQVSPGGHLSLTLQFSNPLNVAAMLASQLHLSALGLRSIALKSSAGDCVSSAGLLAACIASHSSLTRLSLDGLLGEDHQVISLCPHLSSLQDLQHLAVRGCKVEGPCLAALAQAVETLPHLTSVAMGDIHVPHAHWQVSSASTQACESFMQALSVAPKLQQLELAVLRLPCAHEGLMGGFQALQKLTLVVFSNPQPCLECISALTHVTELSLGWRQSQDHEDAQSDSSSDDDGGAGKPWEFYTRVLSQFTNVVSLELRLPDVIAVVVPAPAMITSSLASLQLLKHLFIHCLSTSERCFEQLVPVAPGLALDSLTIGLICFDIAGGRFLNRISELSQLELLDLSVDPSTPVDSCVTVSNLPDLQHLTRLCIRQAFQSELIHSGIIVEFDDVCEDLEQISRLQCLELSGARFRNFQRLCDVLPELVQLTSLKLMHYSPAGVTCCEHDLYEVDHDLYEVDGYQLQDEHVTALSEAVVQLTKLQALHLHHVFKLPHVQQLADAAVKLPVLAEAVISFDASIDQEGSDICNVVDSKTTHSSCNVLPRCLAEILQGLRREVKQADLVAFGSWQPAAVELESI